MIVEWMDRMQYGERVPHIRPQQEAWSANTQSKQDNPDRQAPSGFAP